MGQSSLCAVFNQGRNAQVSRVAAAVAVAAVMAVLNQTDNGFGYKGLKGVPAFDSICLPTETG
ncbi:MAG: hypothetical protein ACAH80_04620 [Alphaproteobacteria bacterium]